jgi:hypothetical protein
MYLCIRSDIYLTFAQDWAVLEALAKVHGPDYFAMTGLAAVSSAKSNWAPNATIHETIKSSRMASMRYKTSSTVMVEAAAAEAAAVGDVMHVELLETTAGSEPMVSYQCTAAPHSCQAQCMGMQQQVTHADLCMQATAGCLHTKRDSWHGKHC